MNRLKYMLYSHVPYRVPSNTVTACGNSQRNICNETSSLSDVFCTRRLPLLPISKQNVSFQSTAANSVSSGSQDTLSPRHAVKYQSGKPFKRRYLKSRLLRNVRSAPETDFETRRTCGSATGHLYEDSLEERNVSSRINRKSARSEVSREGRILREDHGRSIFNRNGSLESLVERPSYRFVQAATIKDSRDDQLYWLDGMDFRTLKSIGANRTSIVKAKRDTQTYAKLISKYVDTLDALNSKVYNYKRSRRPLSTRPSSDYLSTVSSFIKMRRNERNGSSFDTNYPLRTIDMNENEIATAPYQFSNSNRYSEPLGRRKDTEHYFTADGPYKNWETGNDVDEALGFMGERTERTDDVTGCRKTDKVASRSTVESELRKRYSEGGYFDGEDERIEKGRSRRVVQKKRSMDDDDDFSRENGNNEGNESDANSRSYDYSLEYLIGNDSKSPRVTLKMRPTRNAASGTSKIELRVVPDNSEGTISVNVNAKTAGQSNPLKPNASRLSFIIRSEHPDSTTQRRPSSSSSKVSSGSRAADSQERNLESEFVRITIDNGQSTVSTQTTTKHVEFRIDDEIIAELESDAKTDPLVPRTKLNVTSAAGKMEILIPDSPRSRLNEKKNVTLEKTPPKVKSAADVEVSAPKGEQSVDKTKEVQRPVETKTKFNFPNRHLDKLRTDSRSPRSDSKRTSLPGSSAGKRVETVRSTSKDSSEVVDKRELSSRGARPAVGPDSFANNGPKRRARDTSLDSSNFKAENTKTSEPKTNGFKEERADSKESPGAATTSGVAAWRKSAKIDEKKGRTRGTKVDGKIPSAARETGGARNKEDIENASEASVSGSKSIIKDAFGESKTLKSAIQKKSKWSSDSYDNAKVAPDVAKKIGSQGRKEIGKSIDDANSKAYIDDLTRSKLKATRKSSQSLTKVVNNELKKTKEPVSEPNFHKTTLPGTSSPSFGSSNIEKTNIKIKTDLLNELKIKTQKKNDAAPVKGTETKPKVSKTEDFRTTPKTQKIIDEAPVTEKSGRRSRKSVTTINEIQSEKKMPGPAVSSATTKSRLEDGAKNIAATSSKSAQSKIEDKVPSESATTKKEKYDFSVNSAASGSKLRMKPEATRIEVKKKVEEGSAVSSGDSKVKPDERPKFPTTSEATKRAVIKRNQDGTLVDYVIIKDASPSAGTTLTTKAPKSKMKINREDISVDTNKSLRPKSVDERKIVKSETRITNARSSDGSRDPPELKSAISKAKKKSEEPTIATKATSRSKVAFSSSSELKPQTSRKNNEYTASKVKSAGSETPKSSNDRESSKSKASNSYDKSAFIRPVLEKRKDGTVIDYGAKVATRKKLESSSSAENLKKTNSKRRLRDSKSTSGYQMTSTSTKKTRDRPRDVPKLDKLESSNMASAARVKKMKVKDSVELPRTESTTEKKRVESYRKIEPPNKAARAYKKEETTKKAIGTLNRNVSHADLKRFNEIFRKKEAKDSISTTRASKTGNNSVSPAVSRTSSYPVLPEHLRFLLTKKRKDSSDVVRAKKSEKSVKIESNSLKPPKYKGIEAPSRAAKITLNDPVPVQTGFPRLKDFEEDHIFSGPKRHQVNLKRNQRSGVGPSNVGDSKPESSSTKNPDKKKSTEKSDSNSHDIPAIKESRSTGSCASGILGSAVSKDKPEDMKAYGTRLERALLGHLVQDESSDKTRLKYARNRELSYLETECSSDLKAGRITILDQLERPEKSLLYSCWLQRFETRLTEDRRKT